MELDFGEAVTHLAVAVFVLAVVVLITDFAVKEVRKRKHAKRRAENRDNREFLNWLALQADSAIWFAEGKDFAWWHGLSDPERAAYRARFYSLTDKAGPEWWR